MTRNHKVYNDDSIYMAARAMAPAQRSRMAGLLCMLVTCAPAACVVAVLAYVMG